LSIKIVNKSEGKKAQYSGNNDRNSFTKTCKNIKYHEFALLSIKLSTKVKGKIINTSSLETMTDIVLQKHVRKTDTPRAKLIVSGLCLTKNYVTLRVGYGGDSRAFGSVFEIVSPCHFFHSLAYQIQGWGEKFFC
jgi:hypothetical protein